ncbi:hypothetical protein KOR42_22680 [Thalassoglobus neptunius]|uniref:Uncharacterized protein n=1 Tax=Thalassoglobus neptunius TaxID=1938619 RepID=A0A5C5X927_9PLAN|nr:hypothetical protein [Thalassoglobus neptunius]TWT58881.1 hypothetical protein KOR42_22680 [Thalassoglobus neptunius]
MTKKANQQSQSNSDHPLTDFTPTSQTIWMKQKEKVVQFDVRSLQPPPIERVGKETCGRLRLDADDAESAAMQYRKVKGLSEDWPVEVTAVDHRNKNKVVVDKFGKGVERP